MLLLVYFARKAFASQGDAFRSAHRFMLGVIFVGLSAIEIALIMPASPFAGPDKFDKHGVTMQTLLVTCVPVALTNVCRLYGEPMNEYEAARRVEKVLRKVWL